MSPMAAGVVAVLAAMLAVLFALPRSPHRQLHRLASIAPTRTPFRWWLVLPTGAPPLIGSLVDGSRGMVVAFVVEITVVTAGWLVLRWRRRRQALRATEDVAHGCQVLASQLAVGRVPTEALDAAAQDCPVFARGRSASRLGGDVVATWREQAGDPGHHGLLDLARAWQVSELTGAPMAEVLARVASSLARQRRLDGVLGAELAAPRATAQLLAVLPAVGVALGFGLGGDPASFLLEHPLGQSCLAAGVALACSGVVWVERIATHREATARRRPKESP